MTLRVDPIALGGKFDLKMALTAPLFPWAELILPQIV